MVAFLALTAGEDLLPKANGRPDPLWYPLFYALKIALVAGLAPLLEGGACALGPVGNLTGESGHRKREPGHSRRAVQKPAPGRVDIWAAAL